MNRGIVRTFFAAFIISITAKVYAQLPIPADIGKTHPRCFGRNMSHEMVAQLIAKEAWAQQIVKRTEDRLSKYVTYCEKEPDWLLSRLQMYWKTKSTQVYINGGKYDHAEGEAPVPTVRFPGTRDHVTNYFTPALEDVKPYMDDDRGLYLQRRDNKQWEWTDIVSSARITESINRSILELARDASLMYWLTGKEAYAQLAYGVLDTYLTGLYYRTEPIDLSHGHHQTLVGLTSFEVIQEHYIAEVTQGYDFLHLYIVKNHPDKIAAYVATLQKWADQVIKNGVSFNNWDIFQAGHVSRIALVLENNSAYENGKGAQYYLDQVMNKTSTRQWAITKLLAYGYDGKTGIWNESPGYSLGVLRDLIHFVEFYDHQFDIDLIEAMPVLRQAVIASPQYLYPNGCRVAFGDGHYGKLEAAPLLYMIENARKYGKTGDEILFTRMLKTLFGEQAGANRGNTLADLFATAPLDIREDVKPGKLSDFTSPLFYAPKTSWLVQRYGEGDRGLMISQIGSLGNHMHSNGVAMELYGYGLPLAPEMGHGSSYFSIEYAEYYTQFPAHNTVIVNGRSKYPEMKSNHAFALNASYPESGKQQGILPGITFSDVSFLEPETNSDQRRVMGIISDEETGYYIDIFRSRQREGNDVKHEYFYHNLGQQLSLTDTQGDELPMKPTTKMAFGDGDLMAYDYLWNKRSIETPVDFKGQFSLKMEEKNIAMNLWVKGENNREIFSALGPKSTALDHDLLPGGLHASPIPVLVIRQNGEAWNKPFVAIYEPVLNGQSHISSVNYFGSSGQTGIHVTHTSGVEDFIFAAAKTGIWSEGGKVITGSYAVISGKGEDVTLFLGKGESIASEGYQLYSHTTGYFAFRKRGEKYGYAAQYPAELIMPVSKAKAKYRLEMQGKTYHGKVNKRTMTVTFNLPAADYCTVQILTD